jgi:hypothetical protein
MGVCGHTFDVDHHVRDVLHPIIPLGSYLAAPSSLWVAKQNLVMRWIAYVACPGGGFGTAPPST